MLITAIRKIGSEGGADHEAPDRSAVRNKFSVLFPNHINDEAMPRFQVLFPGEKSYQLEIRASK